MSQSTSNTDSGATSPETQFRLPSGRSDSPSNVDFSTSHTHNDILHRSSQLAQNLDGNHRLTLSEPVFVQGGGHPVYNSNNNFHSSDYLNESEGLSLKLPLQGTKSSGDFGAGPFRSSFSAYNIVNGTQPPHSSSGNPPPSSFRMRQINTPSAASQPFASISEGFNHPLGIQHQLSQQSQQGSSISSGLDSRGLDFGNSPPLVGKISQQFALDPFFQPHTSKAQLHDSFHPLSHSNSSSQVPYLNGAHIQSQTPYGPHLQSGGAGATRTLGSSGQLNMTAESQSANNQQEEICTIFVVGFPDDMQEREFQNMFTFSSGFEAATLKIPNKEYTAYGSSGGTPSGLPLRGSSSYSSYFNSGPNDPYNIVTVNQGGVVVDNGRDGPTTSWPPLPVSLNDEPGHFQGPGGQPPRKQIIGFAKFRTRQEALEARDTLQGRRVDIEKGAVLKAEMAKKNLHTKRGVGISGASSSGGSASLGGNLNSLAGLNSTASGLSALGGFGVTPDTLAGLAAGLSLNSNVSMNALTSLGGNDTLAVRERELNALSAMSYNIGSGWREGRLGDSSEEERERDRDRDRERRREALVGLNLGISIGVRGARERALADEEERERLRRKDFKAGHGEAVRMLSGNSVVYDAFHPGSALSRNAQASSLSPSGSTSGDVAGSGHSSVLGSSFNNLIAQNASRDESGSREVVGPWDQPSPRERDPAYSALTPFYGTRKAPVVPRRTASPRDPSPPKPGIPFSPLSDEDGMLPPHRSGILRSTQAFASAVDEPVVSRPPPPPSSSTSSTGGFDEGGPVSLTVSTSEQVSTGNTSPQLPSPASHAGSAASSSGGGPSSLGSAPNIVGSVAPRNALVDQNPPINTLYVGNLPTSPVGAGYPSNYLEDSLRELFSRRPGYRKLCFRQKSNGPMCFVEFEDVHYATKALNELYGNSLGGLVKNGGIRLSYSKNPLGVRTPTTTTSGTGSLLQQQSTHSGVVSPFPGEALQFRQGSDGEPSIANIRRDNYSTATSPPPFGYTRSPPPPRFVSPPPSGSFNMVSSTNGTTLPRGSHAYGIPLNGVGGTFSPFGLPLSSPLDQSSTLPPSHSMIPDHPSSDVPLAHGHTQHFPHRALSPSSSTVEATRAG